MSSMSPRAAGNPMAPIMVEGLTKRFGEVTAVDHVSFAVRAGEVFGWLGPNGAGKTTTIRILLGLMKPTSGTAWVLGFNSVTDAKTIHDHIGYMSQQFTLYNDLTARQNIHFYGMIHGLAGPELRAREDQIVQMAGLEGHDAALTGELSGGWKQRLALGCAIVHRPRVVFLDEPTAGVDPISRREFWDLIYEMTREGVTVLVTTHYMDEAELCQRVGFINHGRLIAADSPRQLKLTHMRGEVLELRCPRPNEAMQILSDAQRTGKLVLDEIALYGARIHAVVPSLAEQTSDIERLLRTSGVHIDRIERIMPSLEDVFISSVRDRTD